MSDLIERLRTFKHGSDHPIKICNEAADEIETANHTATVRKGLLIELREKYAKATAEIEQQSKIIAGLKDPATVWVNMLRGEIARPSALDHYEECKAEIEQKTTAMQNVLDAYDAQTKPIISIRMSNAIRELRPLLTKNSTGFERNCAKCGEEYGGLGVPLCPKCVTDKASK